jgi:ribonuclease Y
MAGMSANDAKAELIRRLEEEAQADAANMLREIRESARRNAEREAKKIVALAIQRIAADTTAESTVVRRLAAQRRDEGRIIGREGRNIRAFELATGVDVIIDDTPDTVVVSCFDPDPSRGGALALEKLVSDGRIHPGASRRSSTSRARKSRRRSSRPASRRPTTPACTVCTPSSSS